MVFSGVVVEGKHLGRTLGFPTINIAGIDGPAAERGVYIGRAWLGGAKAPVGCMLNIGSHPTVPEGPPTVEAHLLGVHQDCYGLSVRVETLAFLRSERRFASVEQLKAQLEEDRRSVGAYFAERPEALRG